MSIPPIKIFERPTSGSSTANPPTLTLEYGLTGIEDSYIANAYATVGTDSSVVTPQGILFRQDVQCDHEGFQLYGITVKYGKEKKETGSFKFSFDTTGGTVHITNSKQTIKSYPEPVIPFAPPDHKGAIGVHGNQIDGADIVIPALKLNYAFKHPAGMITEGKARYLASVTGMVKSIMWHGFHPGELLFLGCTGSDGTDSEVEVTYSLAASASATLTIGEIAGVVKKGHEYAWIQYHAAVDGGRPTMRPQYVYVERVYDEIDFFAALGF